MKKIFITIVFSAISFIFTCNIGLSFAGASQNDFIDQYGFSPEWLALGFYRKTIKNHYLSDVDDDSYFISGQKGYASPKDELLATILAFNHSDDARAESARCLYPARLNWLESSSQGILRPVEIHCDELEAWKSLFQAESVSLVFPAAYLDSPSSMFGHTLLRINAKDKNPILSLSINYAATKNSSDSELAFVYKGLVGGYPGDITVLPYYMKLKEYKDMESRDIWEYQLNFTQPETLFLLDVLWEIKDKKFDYYFFTENCSYRILSFLHSVRPQANILDGFNFATIPVDTVRAVKNHNFVTKINYRPSVKTQFNHAVAQLNKKDQKKVVSWATIENSFSASDLPREPSHAAAVLDTAFEYSRIAEAKIKNKQKVSYDLLKARKDISASSNLAALEKPHYSDDMGHLSNNLTLALGYKDNQQYVAIKTRPAYHDLLDPPLGYPAGSQLEFGALEANYYANSGFKLERFDLVGITSLNARSAFFKPTSWKVRVGLERYDYRQDRVLAGSLEGLMGPTYRLSDAMTAFFLLGGDGRFSSGYRKGFNIYGLSEAGIFINGEHAQTMLKFDGEVSALNSDDRNFSASFEYVYNVSVNRTVSFKLARLYVSGVYSNQVSLAAGLFF